MISWEVVLFFRRACNFGDLSMWPAGRLCAVPRCSGKFLIKQTFAVAATEVVQRLKERELIHQTTK